MGEDRLHEHYDGFDEWWSAVDDEEGCCDGAVGGDSGAGRGVVERGD
jgi:hypothetical protein